MQFQVETRSLGKYDIIVAGGGIAGSFAAASAAREGAKVLLVEAGGCLGGTLTLSSVPSIMDEIGKGGMLAELFAFLNERGMSVARFGKKIDEHGKKIEDKARENKTGNVGAVSDEEVREMTDEFYGLRTGRDVIDVLDLI